MFLTTHAAAGVLIAQRVESPIWIFWLSFLSHFLLDFIPHDTDFFVANDKRTYRRTIIIGTVDFLTLVAMTTILYKTQHVPDFTRMAAGIGGGVAPDIFSHFIPQFHKKYQDQVIIRFLNFIKSKIFRLDTAFRLHGRVHRWFHYCIRDVFEYRFSPIVAYGLQAAILITLVITTFQYG